MATAKDLVIKPIDSTSAREFIRKHHYSGKVAQNSQLHFGVFWNDNLEGVMQFGPSLDKRKIIGLVRDTGWNEFLELNRMAFSAALPRNSESRAIAVAMKLIKKHAPHIKWVISFADATQCGDGTIYRASGFVLTGIKKNDQIWIAPDDTTHSRMSLTGGASLGTRENVLKKGARVERAMAMRGVNQPGQSQKFGKSNGAASMTAYIEAGFRPLEGFQLRYIYFLDPTARERLTVPELPFSEIERRGASMYKGEKITRATAETETGGISNVDIGGANPTVALKHDKQEKRVGQNTDQKARASANKPKVARQSRAAVS